MFGTLQVVTCLDVRYVQQFSNLLAHGLSRATEIGIADWNHSDEICSEQGFLPQLMYVSNKGTK